MKSNTRKKKIERDLSIGVTLPAVMSFKKRASVLKALRRVAMQQRIGITVEMRLRKDEVAPAAKKKYLKAVEVKRRDHPLATGHPVEEGKRTFYLAGRFHYIASHRDWAVVRCPNLKRARTAASQTFGRGMTVEVRRATQDEIRRYIREMQTIDDV